MNGVLLTLKTFTGNIHMVFLLEVEQKHAASHHFILAVQSTSSMAKMQNVDINCSEALKDDFIVRVTCLCTSVTGQKYTLPVYTERYNAAITS